MNRRGGARTVKTRRRGNVGGAMIDKGGRANIDLTGWG